jgi:hypothetical protein
VKRAALFAALALAAAGCGAQKMKNQYKVTRFNPWEVGVSCENGADPTTKNVSGVLIVSCGNNVYRNEP